MDFTIEFEREEDGRWLAEILELPGVLAYGNSPDDAIAHVKALALRVVADEIEHAERSGKVDKISFATL
jgi:predicted RNase H-like HicB family nuclease